MISNTPEYGIYIHYPFCAKKCPYCDFNSKVQDDIDHQRWQLAYLKALDHYAAEVPEARIISIFFGGGTPSLMPPGMVQSIIDRVKERWICDPDIEITLEANPTSVETAKLEAFHAAGVNRVSLGVQSLRDQDLEFFGREHSGAEAIKAIEEARSMFDRYSFDLIYARPGQSLKDWEAELKEALPHANGHMSLYQLTIERNTPFYFDHQQKRFQMPGQDLAADFYLLTQDVMESGGLPAYEVSNHAAEEHESRHNMIYWHYGNYIGIGPGAHGRIVKDGAKYATRDHWASEKWLEQVEAKGHGAHRPEALSAEDQFAEALMVGLRIKDGVHIQGLARSLALDLEQLVSLSHLKKIEEEGWGQYQNGCLSLSHEGWLRLNAVINFILQPKHENNS